MFLESLFCQKVHQSKSCCFTILVPKINPKGHLKHHNHAFLHHQIIFSCFCSHAAIALCNIFGTDKASCCSMHNFAKVSSNALDGLSNFHNLGKPFPLPLVLYYNVFKNVPTLATEDMFHRMCPLW